MSEEAIRHAINLLVSDHRRTQVILIEILNEIKALRAELPPLQFTQDGQVRAT